MANRKQVLPLGVGGRIKIFYTNLVTLIELVAIAGLGLNAFSQGNQNLAMGFGAGLVIYLWFLREVHFWDKSARRFAYAKQPRIYNPFTWLIFPVGQLSQRLRGDVDATFGVAKTEEEQVDEVYRGKILKGLREWAMKQLGYRDYMSCVTVSRLQKGEDTTEVDFYLGNEMGFDKERFILSAKTKLDGYFLGSGIPAYKMKVEMRITEHRAILCVVFKNQESKADFDATFAFPPPFFAKTPTEVTLGVDDDGNEFRFDFQKTIHVLVGGRAGRGKSVGTRNILVSLMKNILAGMPIEIEVHDPKRVDYNWASGLAKVRIVKDVPVMMERLRAFVAEMEERYVLLEKSGKMNLASLHATGDTSLPFKVIIMDEIQDLMLQDDIAEEVEGLIARTGAKARAAGMFLLLSTQRPDMDIITGKIKANMGAVIGFGVRDGTNSKIICGDSNLLLEIKRKGECRFICDDYRDGEPVSIKTFFTDEKYCEDFAKEYLKKMGQDAVFVEEEAKKVEVEAKKEEVIKTVETLSQSGKSGILETLRNMALEGTLSQSNKIAEKLVGSQPKFRKFLARLGRGNSDIEGLGIYYHDNAIQGKVRDDSFFQETSTIEEALREAGVDLESVDKNEENEIE